MIEMERRIHYETYSQWQKRKKKLIDIDCKPTIQRFVKIYESNFRHQSEAQYLRSSPKMDFTSSHQGGKTKINANRQLR